MAFTDRTFFLAAFKKLQGSAHTDNTKEPSNEPLASQVLIAASQIIGDEVASDPVTASGAGVIEHITAELELDPTSNGKAYRAKFPAGYAGAFGSGAIGDFVTEHTFAISPGVVGGGSPATSLVTTGYAVRLEDNGTLVPATSSEDWFFDYFNTIVTSEDDLSLGSTGTVDIWIYTGDTVVQRLNALASGVAGGGVTDINTVSGSVTIAGADGNTIVIDGQTITVSGFQTEFVNASGSLQSQIDSINVDEIEPAIVGVDGISVISGTNTTVSGFRGEFVSASGSLQTQIDGIDSNVTLQDAYDNSPVVSAGKKIETVGSTPVTISGASGTQLKVEGSIGSGGQYLVELQNYNPAGEFMRFRDLDNVELLEMNGFAPDGGNGVNIRLNQNRGGVQTKVIDLRSTGGDTTVGNPTAFIGGWLVVSSGVSVSGIDIDINALVGDDGITVSSGTPAQGTTQISGFRSEFVSASGSLQTQIDNIDSSVTLQEAYDNGDGTILTTGASKPVLISGTVIASGTDGKFIASDGSFTFPSYTFEGDTSTGFYLAAAGAFGITAGGSNSLFLTTSEVQAIDPLRVPLGSQSSAGIRFPGDVDTGFYSPAADTIGLTAGNSTELVVSGTDTGNSGVGIKTRLTTSSGIFTDSLTVSGSPVCIDCPDFSQFATITELVTTSGHLQTQIDSINVDEIEPAIVGDNGIVVTSGVDTTTVQASGTMALTSGTYTESLTVSGTPVELAGAVDLQVAYDNSADGLITIPPGIGQKGVSISGSFSGLEHGLMLGGQDVLDLGFTKIPSVLSIYGEASFGHFTIRGLAPAAQPQFFGTTARGTFDSPLISQGGDVAFSMGGLAYDGDNYAALAAINSVVAAPVVSGSNIIQGRLVFSTTDSTGNQNAVMTVHSTESVSINETNPGIVDPYALYVVGSGIFTDDLVVNDDFSADTGAFTTSLTVSGSPVCINCPDFSTFATLTDLTTTSGHLQNQIDSINVDEIEPAIVGVDGITVISGSNTTVSGFRTEFVSASGSLQSQIDGIDPNVTLQDAYDDGNDITIAAGRPVEIDGSAETSIAALTFNGSTDYPIIQKTIFGDEPLISAPAGSGGFTTTLLTATGTPNTSVIAIESTPNLTGVFRIDTGNVATRIEHSESSNEAYIYPESATFFQIWSNVQTDVGAAGGGLVSINRDQVTGNFRMYSTSANDMMFGDFATGRIGIGTDLPGTELSVLGTISGTNGQFEDSLTVSGSPVCIDCPDFSQFATTAELVTVSGHLQTQIDAIDSSVTLQEAYDNGDGTIITNLSDSVIISGSAGETRFGDESINIDVGGFPVGLGAIQRTISESPASEFHLILQSFSSSGALDSPNLLLTRARGSEGSPSILSSGDTLGTLGWYGFNGASGYVPGATITAVTASAPVDSPNNVFPTTLSFNTITTSGGPQPSTRLSINEEGNVVVPQEITAVTGTITETLIVDQGVPVPSPSIAFGQVGLDNETGFYGDIFGDAISVLISGSTWWTMSRTRMLVAAQVQAPNPALGSDNNTPAYSFFDDPDTGMYNKGIGDRLAFAVGGEEAMLIGPAGDIFGQDSFSEAYLTKIQDQSDDSNILVTKEYITLVSGSLQSDIDAIDSSVTLQDAYDNGNTITTVSGSPITIDGAADSSNGLIDLDVTGMQGGIRNSVFSSTVPLISSASTIGQTLTLLEMDETVQNEVRIDIAGNLFSTFSLTDGSAGNILDIAIAEVAATTFITPTLPILLLQAGATDGANVSSIRLAPATGGEIFLNPNAVDIDTHINAAGVQPALYVDGASGNVGIRTDMPWCELTVVSGMCVSGTGSAYTFIDENLVTVVSGIQISAHGAHPVVSSPALNTGTTVLYSATNEVSSNTLRVEMGASDIASFILTQNTAGDANISMSVSDFFGATSIVGDGAFTIANNNNATMALASTADLTLRGAAGSAVWVNPLAEDVDFRVSGDNDLDLIYANAAVDRVGIGTEVPGEKLSVEGTISGSTLKTGDGNVEGLIEDQSGMIDLPVGKNYTLVQSAKYDFTIDEITHQTVAGTCSGTLTINGTAIEGMDNLIMNSSETTSTATASFTVNAGDRVQLAISGTSDAEDLAFTWQRTRL